MMFHLFSDEENEMLREEYQDTLLYKWLYKPCSDFAKDDNTTYLFLTPEEVMYLMMEEYGSKAFQTEIKEVKGSLHTRLKDDVSYMAQLKSIDAHIENQLRDCVLRATNCSKQELREKYMSDVLANKQLVVYALALGLIFMNTAYSQVGAFFLEGVSFIMMKPLLREYFSSSTLGIDASGNKELNLSNIYQYMEPTYTVKAGVGVMARDGECTSYIGKEVKSILLGEGLRFVPLKTLKQGKSGKVEPRELKVEKAQGVARQMLKTMKAQQERVKDLEMERAGFAVKYEILEKEYDKLRSENEKLVKEKTALQSENKALQEGAKAGTAEEVSMTPIRIAPKSKTKVTVLLSAMYYAGYFKAADPNVKNRDQYVQALLRYGLNEEDETDHIRKLIDNSECSVHCDLSDCKEELKRALKSALDDLVSAKNEEKRQG